MMDASSMDHSASMMDASYSSEGDDDSYGGSYDEGEDDGSYDEGEGNDCRPKLESVFVLPAYTPENPFGEDILVTTVCDPVAHNCEASDVSSSGGTDGKAVLHDPVHGLVYFVEPLESSLMEVQ